MRGCVVRGLAVPDVILPPAARGKWAGHVGKHGRVDGGRLVAGVLGAVSGLPPIDLPEPCGSCSPLPPAARVEGLRGGFFSTFWAG